LPEAVSDDPRVYWNKRSEKVLAEGETVYGEAGPALKIDVPQIFIPGIGRISALIGTSCERTVAGYCPGGAGRIKEVNR
jgi:hypothetical protein